MDAQESTVNGKQFGFQQITPLFSLPSGQNERKQFSGDVKNISLRACRKLRISHRKTHSQRDCDAHEQAAGVFPNRELNFSGAVLGTRHDAP